MGSETSTGRKRHGDCISKEEYIKCYSFEDNNTPEDNTEGKPNKKLIEKAFEIALDTRKFEIDLYWKRTAYFVLFIGAIFVGYYISFMVYGKSREQVLARELGGSY